MELHTEKDNCKLSSIEKIDFVLRYLAHPENKGAYHSINDIRVGEVKWFNRLNFYESITSADLVIIMMKLIKENQVVEFNKLMGDSFDEIRFSANLFKISFDGLMWLDRGGYQGQFDRDNAAVDRQATEDQRNKYLLVITFAIGIGTMIAAFYYAFYLFDYYEIHRLNWQMCAYFLTGLVAGLLLWLTVWLLLRVLRKSKSKVA